MVASPKSVPAFPIPHWPCLPPFYTNTHYYYLKIRRGQRLESGNSSKTLTHSLMSLESQRLKKVTTTSDQRDSDSVQGVNMALLTICCMTIGWACLTVNQSERRGFKCEEEKKEGLEAHFSSFCPKRKRLKRKPSPGSPSELTGFFFARRPGRVSICFDEQFLRLLARVEKVLGNAGNLRDANNNRGISTN